MKEARKVLDTYKKLLSIIARRAPVMVAMTFVLAIVSGALIFASTLVNQRIVDDGLRVASGAMAFGDYFPWLALLVATMVLPPVIDLFIFSYITSRSQMILNTDYKGEMLQKLGRVKYEHFENSQSVEIIDKATSRAMNSARHLYPMYLFNALSGAVASIGLLWQLGQAKWWLLLTTLIPFALQRWYDAKHSYNIYDELEHYWNKERRYSILAGFLKSRDYLYEGKLNGCADFLIRTYRDRLHERNKEYETYYFKHLKQHLLRAGSIMNLASLGNALLLLYLYSQGEISVGALVALTMMVFSSLPTH
ncbi:MAG TPA: ABC transporter ATP-binding protein, partial [Candidatus Alectryocaccomicrobium excrementavium]|nr:ABC transporter ATP-binding protein [Candidatus Alectryocaccomicrobium excrementavium]